MKQRWRLPLIILFINIFVSIFAFTMTSAQDRGPGDLYPVPSKIPEGFRLLDGDIIMPDAYFERTEERSTYKPDLWTNGVVPFQFAVDVTPQNRDRTYAAMAEWEVAAGVDFIPRTSQSSYIEIINASGNYSSVGMVGGRQELGMYNWNYKYIIAHELGHALGLWHEQSRADRDSYIQINWGNIESGKEFNFNIQSDQGSYGAYDFDSVMHYGQYSFSVNSLPTISVKAPYTSWQNLIGQRSRLSDGDKATMAYLYPPITTGVDNDEFADALVIDSLTYTHAVNTGAATSAAYDPFPTCSYEGQSVGHTVWYKFTSGSAASTLTLTSEGYDTVLSVWTGTQGALSQVGCKDDFGAGKETLVMSPASSTTYYVMVAGFMANSGGLTFTATFVPQAPDNDDFDNALIMSTIPFYHTVDTTNATGGADDPDPTCTTYPVGSTVWYRYTAPVTGELTVLAGGFDIVLSAWSGVRGSLTQLSCVDEEISADEVMTISVTEGANYYLMAGGWDNDYGTLELIADVDGVVSNFVSNGGMEADSDTDGIPDSWTGKNTLNDKQKCGKGYNATCGFIFTGDFSGKSGIMQEMTFSGSTSDQFTLAFWAQNKGVPIDSIVKLKLKFYDGSVNSKIKLSLIPSDQTTYLYYAETDIVPPQNFTSVRFQVDFNSPVGKLYFDDFSLSYTTASDRAMMPQGEGELLPLPGIENTERRTMKVVKSGKGAKQKG